MFHILTKCSLFLSIGEDSHVQMIGISISEYVTPAGRVIHPPEQRSLKRTSETVSGEPRKRRRLSIMNEPPKHQNLWGLEHVFSPLNLKMNQEFCKGPDTYAKSD